MPAQPIYSIRYPVGVDTALGRIAVETNYAKHVEQMILQVLLTNPGERPHRPDFGCGVRRLLFAPNDPTLATLTQVTVYQALTRWLGSVIEVGAVEVQALESTLAVTVRYVLKARMERRILNIEVTR
ncbi:GPW/gp25 family protein [Desulfobacca acetoxidans]|uniref:GPW/gp25 family protein n=1 Tax=Desulfobacca acetoxidans (strain ATCC 700848 / DSM 11109 / ASRB2) TaxID=880072 RepID=F2NI29_DESAR|nr:GPW/gp25 family protein [Desulfobacca acetoxidans]AEB09655.1 GPW/gp25 family protein [Desulfobacca acetoxidans DSM 11109]